MELHNEVQKVFQFFIWNQWALAQTRAWNQNQLGAIASSIDIGVYNKIVWIGFFSAAAAALSIHFHFFLLFLSFFCYFFMFFSGRPKLEIAWKTLLFAGRLVRRRRRRCRHIMRSSIKTNTKYKLKINNLTLCQIMGTEEWEKPPIRFSAVETANVRANKARNKKTRIRNIVMNIVFYFSLNFLPEISIEEKPQ